MGTSDVMPFFMDEVEYVTLKGHKSIRTGSSYVCSPPVTDTDRDYVVVYTDELHERLVSLGYTYQGDDQEHSHKYPNSSVEQCYRKDNINIVAVKDDWHMTNWEQATALAVQLNLKDKDQRVGLFQFLTEGAVRETGTRNPLWPQSSFPLHVDAF